MKTTFYTTSLIVLGGLLCVVVCGAERQKPTLTKEILMQVVEKGKKGDKASLSTLGQELVKKADQIIVPSELLPDFVALLEGDKPELQLLGAQGLYVLKSPQSKEALVKYLRTKDLPKIRKLAEEKKIDRDEYFQTIKASCLVIMTLGEIGDKSLLPLLESLRDVEGLRGEGGAGAVELALAKLGPEGVESLSKLGPDADGNARFAAQNAIRAIRNPKQVPALIATVRDKQSIPGIREAAIDALGSIKEVDTSPFLLSILKDPQNGSLRASAARAAANTKQPKVEQELLAMLESSDNELRPDCWLALVTMKPGVYLPKVLAIANDKSANLSEREKLAEGLSYIAGIRHLVANTDQMLAGTRAEKSDGTPADGVRVFMWKTYNKATGKEPPLEVRDEKLAKRYLVHDIQLRIRRENVHASAAEREAMIDQKINSILTKWEWPAPIFCTKGYESRGWVKGKGFRLCCWSGGSAATGTEAAQPAENSAGVR